MFRRVLPTPSSLRADVAGRSYTTGQAPPKGEEEGLAHDSAPPVSGRVGRARGGRASPGACFTYRFDEADLPRAAVFHAPSGWRPLLQALPDRAVALAGADARRTWRQAPAVRAGSARRANRSHPSTPARTPGVSVPRASSLDHSPPTSGRWIRRPPHRRVERIMGAARGRPMIPFEKLAGRWKGGGFWGEPDYGSADCERSVMAPTAALHCSAIAFAMPGKNRDRSFQRSGDGGM